MILGCLKCGSSFFTDSENQVYCYGCESTLPGIYEILQAEKRSMDADPDWEERHKHEIGPIFEALSIATDYGMFDGAHHKMWVIDQMVRALLGNKYDDWVKKYNSDEDYAPWDTGIAP